MGLHPLLSALAQPTEPLVHAFNFYARRHPDLDVPDVPRIRLANLAHYLCKHQHARIALIGEAAGYSGCCFTGIPFTCEAQLRKWNDSRYRTGSLLSDHDERSARCAWQVVGMRDDVIFWNAFPWHPHRPDQPLSNRQPSAAELHAGCFVLKLFLGWNQLERIIAVGRVAERALREVGEPAAYVRHPSHGGQRDFESAIHSLP